MGQKKQNLAGKIMYFNCDLSTQRGSLVYWILSTVMAINFYFENKNSNTLHRPIYQSVPISTTKDLLQLRPTIKVLKCPGEP